MNWGVANGGGGVILTMFQTPGANARRTDAATRTNWEFAGARVGSGCFVCGCCGFVGGAQTQTHELHTNYRQNHVRQGGACLCVVNIYREK